MRIEEVGEGNHFQTRLTGRTGVVCGVGTKERGVLVEWVGTGGVTTLVHRDCEVDVEEERK